MRKLIITVLVLALVSVDRVAARSASPADVVAAGRTALLVVDAGRNRIGLIDIEKGSLRQRPLPFTLESRVLYDPAAGVFRGFGRTAAGGNLILWSLDERTGKLTTLKTAAARVEAFVRSPSGHLFVRIRGEQEMAHVGSIERNGIAITIASDDSKSPPDPNLALDGHDVVGDDTVIADGILKQLSLPLSARKDRLWHEARLQSGWILVDPMTGDVRWSRDGLSWETRPTVGGPGFGDVKPYSVEPTFDGKEVYVVSSLGNVNDRKRLLSRIDLSGIATPVVEFGKELGSLVAGPSAMWLTGGAADEPTIRFATVTASGISPIRSVTWPID
jgi:hypothetical protein